MSAYDPKRHSRCRLRQCPCPLSSSNWLGRQQHDERPKTDTGGNKCEFYNFPGPGIVVTQMRIPATVPIGSDDLCRPGARVSRTGPPEALAVYGDTERPQFPYNQAKKSNCRQFRFYVPQRQIVCKARQPAFANWRTLSGSGGRREPTKVQRLFDTFTWPRTSNAELAN